MDINKIKKYQEAVLKALKNQMNDFHLAGGTALSLFYFQHRLSVDLDFFTFRFDYKRIQNIIQGIQKALNKDIKPGVQVLDKDRTRMMIFYIHFDKKNILKIDFVDDVLELIKPLKYINGINVLSLQDIFLRKIYTIAGVIHSIDDVGRKSFIGGRNEAKDFYDLYFLSHTFMPLSRFVEKHGNINMIESLIRWFRSYDRMSMIDGILEIITHNDIDYKKMEKHFEKEINIITDKQLRDI